jgi:hypothetical protein
MKKSTIIISALCLITSIAFAQKNVVKINPLGLIFSTLPITYERVISPKISLGGEVSVLFYSATAGTTTTTFFGGGLELKPKFSIATKKEMPRGWYISPVVGYAMANGTGKDGNGNNASGGFSIINAGAIAGYQWVFGGAGPGFALDLNGGANYLKLNTTGQASGIKLEGILPRIGIGLGYAF